MTKTPLCELREYENDAHFSIGKGVDKQSSSQVLIEKEHLHKLLILQLLDLLNFKESISKTIIRKTYWSTLPWKNVESSGTLLIYLLTPCFTLKTLKNLYMKALQNLLLNDFELLLAPFASKSIIFVMNIDGLVHVIDQYGLKRYQKKR